MDLQEEYRPKSFSQVVGNTIPIKILVNMIKKGRIPKGILFHGPQGSGKTTLARLIVKALHCRNFLYDVCGICENCLFFEKYTLSGTGYEFHDYIKIGNKASSSDKIPSVDYTHHDCSKITAKILDDILLSFRFPGFSSTGLIIHILDEFQRASIPLQDKFLIPLEDYRNILLIFCLIDLDKIQEPFRQRVRVLKTTRPEIPELLPWMQKICTDKEIILKDSGALGQVATSADRLPRGCLSLLEKALLWDEPLSTDLVRELAKDLQESKYRLNG